MTRSFLATSLALAAATLVAVPASAQTGSTHVDAAGAVSGRSPHRMMRPIAAEPNCERTAYVPAGKLPTYGTAALDPRCRQTVLASTAGAKNAAQE